MKNFNSVFEAIKSLSEENGEIKGGDVLDQIAQRSGIDKLCLHPYLQMIRDLALIKYCEEKGVVRLTEYGLRKRGVRAE